ncbi:MAG: NADH-quinone oxidoreductase subunit C [Campylobacterota bacterium]|nr:NADH-quinone oxidoreductase subunit C [Campylobacterota bacterium]
MIENIKDRYIVCHKKANLYSIKIDKDELLNCVDFLKSNGFITLSHITCTDWIEDDIFSLNYNFTTKKRDINLFVQVDIKREDESITSLSNIFIQSQVMERDLHEMFGIKFIGNDNLGDFALENWNDIPPLRREFDTLAYVNEHFDFRGGRDDNKDTKAETKRRKLEAKAKKALEESQKVDDEQ